MAQRTEGVRSPLSSPLVYEAMQRAFGVQRYRRRLVREVFHIRPQDRVLDIGCGPGDLLPFLPPGIDYVGFDLSEPYIERARSRHGAAGRFHCADVNQARFLQKEPPFDVAIALGVLHHLDDHEVLTLYASVARMLVPGGRLVTVDPVLTDGQNPVARWLIGQDRGLCVRDADGYLELALRWFAVARPTIRVDLLHVPYTHLIIEHTEPRPATA